MDLNNLPTRVNLQCPTCGGEEFSSEGDLHTCARCGMKQSKDALLAANGARIHGAVENLGAAFVKEARDSLVKALRGNKMFKIR